MDLLTEKLPTRTRTIYDTLHTELFFKILFSNFKILLNKNHRLLVSSKIIPIDRTQ